MKHVIKSVFIILVLSSCSNIFNEVVLTNQCKRCEVINRTNGEVLYSDEGCGGDNTRIEAEAKIEAYNLSQGGRNLCDLDVRCTTWNKDKVD